MKKSFSLFRYDLNVQVVRSSTGPHSTKSGPHLVPIILLTVQVSQLSRMNLLKCNPETIKCDESNLIIICIRYLMPDCLLNSPGAESHKIRHRSNYASATHSHPWRAKKMDTTSVSNSLLISFYEESNCICLPQVTSEWDRQTPKELAMLKRLKGRDAEESEVGAEDFINANTTSQLTEEGRTWVCMSRVTF